MIKEFVEAYYKNQDVLRERFALRHPDSYMEVVKNVVEILPSVKYHKPDKDRIHEVDDGDWQGTLVYVIGETGYQPSTYWYVLVYYGSCSGCDTLQSIWQYDDDPPNEKQVNDYMTLALHIIQGLKQMEDNDE